MWGERKSQRVPTVPTVRCVVVSSIGIKKGFQIFRGNCGAVCACALSLSQLEPVISQLVTYHLRRKFLIRLKGRNPAGVLAAKSWKSSFEFGDTLKYKETK